jgi:hypothetical protein
MKTASFIPASRFTLAPRFLLPPRLCGEPLPLPPISNIFGENTFQLVENHP